MGNNWIDLEQERERERIGAMRLVALVMLVTVTTFVAGFAWLIGWLT